MCRQTAEDRRDAGQGNHLASAAYTANKKGKIVNEKKRFLRPVFIGMKKRRSIFGVGLIRACGNLCVLRVRLFPVFSIVVLAGGSCWIGPFRGGGPMVLDLAVVANASRKKNSAVGTEFVRWRRLHRGRTGRKNPQTGGRPANQKALAPRPTDGLETKKGKRAGQKGLSVFGPQKRVVS